MPGVCVAVDWHCIVSDWRCNSATVPMKGRVSRRCEVGFRCTRAAQALMAERSCYRPQATASQAHILELAIDGAVRSR